MKITKEQWLTISLNLKKIYQNDHRPNSVIEDEYFEELKIFEFEDVRSAINKLLANHTGYFIPHVNAIKEVIQHRINERGNAFQNAFSERETYDATPHINFLQLIVRAHEVKKNESLINSYKDEFVKFWDNNMGKWKMDKENFLETIYGIDSKLGIAVETEFDKAEVPF